MDAIYIICNGIVGNSVIIWVQQVDTIIIVIRTGVIIKCDIGGVNNKYPNRGITAVLVLNDHLATVSKDHLTATRGYGYPLGVCKVVDRLSIHAISGINDVGVPVFERIAPKVKAVVQQLIVGEGVETGFYDVDALVIVGWIGVVCEGIANGVINAYTMVLVCETGNVGERIVVGAFQIDSAFCVQGADSFGDGIFIGILKIDTVVVIWWTGIVDEYVVIGLFEVDAIVPIWIAGIVRKGIVTRIP